MYSGNKCSQSASNPSADEITNVLLLCMTSRGNDNIGDLLAIDPRWLEKRKMPAVAVMVNFVDIALRFVRLAPPLKLKFVPCYDALLQAQPPFELEKH